MIEERPKHLRYMKPKDWETYSKRQDKHIDMMEIELNRLSDGLNDIIIILKNMQKKGM